MANLLLTDVPADVMGALERQAHANGRSVEDVVVEMLKNVVIVEGRREPGPIFMTEEITAPFVIPHPPGVPVEAKFLGDYKPDFTRLLREVEGDE